MSRGEPPIELVDPLALLLGQLAYYRSTLIEKLDGLSEHDQRVGRLPSGWSPLELLKHLAYVEQRWMRWGFEGEDVPDPWGDNDPETHRWVLDAEDTLEGLTEWLAAMAERTEAVASRAALTDRGRLGGRFDTRAPTLGWILLHLLQEYARHVGQLDVVVELIDGRTGE
jgi:uncharacterized damage-inducible protein DinB